MDHMPEVIYTVEDVNKAFSMGLETAVVVLENALFLSRSGQRQLIDRLKEQIEKDKTGTIGSEKPWTNSKMSIVKNKN